MKEILEMLLTFVLTLIGVFLSMTIFGAIGYCIGYVLEYYKYNIMGLNLKVIFLDVTVLTIWLKFIFTGRIK
jgi:membrane protein DedA with SNARE-associated domain